MNFKLNDDFEVIDLGIQELDVYDIEVEKTHNFFGNNICVHNSTYVNIDEIVKKRWPDITDPQKLTDLIDEFADNDLGKYIQECYEQLAKYMNCDENLLDMKRECIAESFIIRAKKNYIMKIYDAEKVRYAEPYYKMMGIEVVRTSHPIMVRDALEHALKIVIDGTQSELRKFVAAFKDEFMNAPLNKIGSPRGVTDINKYSNKDFSAKEYEMILDASGKMIKKKVTIPIHVTASINYNKLISSLKLSNRYEYIRNGSNFDVAIKNFHNIKKFCPNAKIECSSVISKLNFQNLEKFPNFIYDTFPETNLLHLFSMNVWLKDIEMYALDKKQEEELENFKKINKNFKEMLIR